jgi:hypothetical protein
MSSVKYPQVKVRLVGEDGNAFSILGRCEREARRAGLDAKTRKAFADEATSGDYNHLLATVMEWFDTDPEEDGNFCAECGIAIDEWDDFCADCEED